MNKYELIAYASDFASFLIRRKEAAKNINKIILFGSVSRGDFDDDSDVDIFIDSRKDIEKDIQEILKLYNSSKQKEFWELSGIRNPISIKVGKLEQWKSIERPILTDGITLYGKYEKLPKTAKHYGLFRLNFENKKRNEKVTIWRKLYGYKQKIEKKTYYIKGLLIELEGKKLENGIVLVPIERIQEIYKFLRNYKIKYEIFEIWSDSL